MTAIDGEDIETYHRHPAVSHSGFRTYHKKGPRAFYQRHVKGGHPQLRTTPMVVGQAFEDYVNESLGLEDSFSKYEIKPEGFNGRTKDGKAWLATMRSEKIDVLDQKDVDMFEAMLAGIQELPAVWELLQQAQTQMSYRVECDGLPGLQSRPDWTIPDNDLIGLAHIDLKTCLDLEGFDKSITQWGYHTQAACVRRSAGLDAYFLLAVEKSFPNRAQLIQMDNEFMDLGDRWLDRQIAGLRGCFKENHWPRVLESTRIAQPPQWLKDLEAA